MEPLPRHLQQPRPSQVKAVAQIMDAFEDGAQVVVLNGPTGSGKTLIGEMVRRELDEKGIYCCTTIGLQNQFLTDFTYAKLLKGRANYPTEHRDDKTAEDCAGREACLYCDEWKYCPYQVAQREALEADLAVLNTAYWLAEVNLARGLFSKQDFIIFDEADELESALMGFVEFRSWSPQRMGLQYLEPPKKSARIPTMMNWLGEYTTRIKSLMHTARDVKEANRCAAHLGEIKLLVECLQEEIARAGDVEEDEKVERLWVRDYSKEERVIYKPVRVSQFGEKYLWRHSKKFLLMSATMIAPEYRLTTLGFEGEMAVVDMPMTFPVENRPIYVCSLASMNFKERTEQMPRLVDGIVAIAEKNPDVRVLVHTVSYQMTKDLFYNLRRRVRRTVVSYTTSKDRDVAMATYEATPNAIMLAPSMSRGFDFKEDLARVVIIIKVPYASIGDRQVSTRLWSKDGRMWYDVQAVSEIVQMTGRGVRSETDTCETWILDADFGKKLWRERKELFPRWWRDAVAVMPPSGLIGRGK